MNTILRIEELDLRSPKYQQATKPLGNDSPLDCDSQGHGLHYILRGQTSRTMGRSIIELIHGHLLYNTPFPRELGFPTRFYSFLIADIPLMYKLCCDSIFGSAAYRNWMVTHLVLFLTSDRQWISKTFRLVTYPFKYRIYFQRSKHHGNQVFTHQ